jgi:hypothetical protein
MFLVSSCFLLLFPAHGMKAADNYLSFLSNTSFYNFYSPTTSESDKFTLYIQDGYLNIKYGKPQELLNGEVILYNLLGQEITRKKLEALPLNQIQLQLQGTCYIVRIVYSGKVYTQKIIVK